MENTNFKDLLPLSVGNTHIINDSYVSQFDIAHRDKQDVTKIGQEAFKYEVYLKGIDKLPEIELEETPKPPANQLAFIANIPESFELGDEDVTITIETNADSYDGDITNEAVAHYNRALDTITPLKVGDTEIVFTATKEEETQEFRFPIKVVDDIVDTPPQVTETPDNADEPNFTDEELAVVLCNRARYEDLKEFYIEWAGLNGLNDEAQAKGALYQEMRQSITALQAKETAPTFKAMDIDKVKEATKFIGRIGVLMSNGAGGGMFEWWEEVPTLVSPNSYEQESTEKLNTILAKHFVLPMTGKEDFLYNYYLTSSSGRGIGGYSGMLQIMEWYLAGAHEDSMWFIENLASIPLSKIEAYSYLTYIVNNAPYNTFSDEASKKELASFYLSQIVMSGKTGGGSGKTKEQILAEINVKSIDEKLDQVGEDFFNRARERGVVLTQANFAVFNDSNMTSATGALIYVFASILAAAGKDTTIINVFNELFREQGISNTTKEQNIRVYRKIKTKFMELEVINKCVDFISVEQGFIYSQKNIETHPYDLSYYEWTGDGSTIGERILEFGVYIFNVTKLGKIEKQMPEIFLEYRDFVNTGEQELYIAKEIDKAIIAKHKGS